MSPPGLPPKTEHTPFKKPWKGSYNAQKHSNAKGNNIMEVQSSSFETGTEAKSSGGVKSTLMGTKPVSAEDGPRAHTPIDPFSDELLTLAQAAALCPKVNGKRPRCSTIWRWCKKGSHGATLGHVRIGWG